MNYLDKELVFDPDVLHEEVPEEEEEVVRVPDLPNSDHLDVNDHDHGDGDTQNSDDGRDNVDGDVDGDPDDDDGGKIFVYLQTKTIVVSIII